MKIVVKVAFIPNQQRRLLRIRFILIRMAGLYLVAVDY